MKYCKYSSFVCLIFILSLLYYGTATLSNDKNSSKFRKSNTITWPVYSITRPIVDSVGNIFVAGCYRDSVDLNPWSGVDSHNSLGYYDAYIVKLGINYDYIWGITWGGPGMYDRPLDIAVDGNGSIYVTGSFMGMTDFDPGPGTTEKEPDGEWDIFLAKYSTDGSFKWVRTWGGMGGLFTSEMGASLCIDKDNYVYVTGSFVDTADFSNGDKTHTITSNGNTDGFLSKYSPDGAIAWVRTWGGAGIDFGSSIVVDDRGYVYLSGAYSGTIILKQEMKSERYTSVGGIDALIIKYDKDGNIIWTNTFGGQEYDLCSNIVFNNNGYIYVTGSYAGVVDFDPSSNIDERRTKSYHNVEYELSDIFVAKYDNNGNYAWVKTMGGIGSDMSTDIAVDKYGNIYLTGSFSEVVDFDLGPGIADYSYYEDYLHSPDAFMLKVNDNGNYEWVKIIGGNGEDYGIGVYVGESDNILFTGNYSNIEALRLEDVSEENSEPGVFLISQ